jgi:outer membrane protein OmpA-like peptidoglycan-associated protein
MGGMTRSNAIESCHRARRRSCRAWLLDAVGSSVALALLWAAPANAQQSGNGSVIVDYGVLEQLGTPTTIPGGLTGRLPAPPYGAYPQPQPYGAYPQPQPYGAYGQRPYSPYAGTPQLLYPPATMPRSTLTVPYKPSPSIVDVKPALKPTQQTATAPAETAATPPPPPQPAPVSPPPPAPEAPASAGSVAPAPSAPSAPAAPAAEIPTASATPAPPATPSAATTTANGVAVSTNIPTPAGGSSAPAASAESSAETAEVGETNETGEAAEAAAPAAPAPSETAAASAEAAAPATAETQNAALPPAAGEAGAGEKTQILFAEGSAELPPEATAQLDAIADKLAKDEGLRLQLMAYASGTEDTASKARRISLSRALAVRAYLIDKGIRSTRMDVRALGNKVEGEPADRVDIVTQPAQ